MRFLGWLVALILFGAANAHAAYVVYLYERGADVVASGSGTLDLTGLSFVTTGNQPAAQMRPRQLTLGSGAFEVFSNMSVPAPFAPAANALASSWSGDTVGIGGAGGLLLVPNAYVPGTPVVSSATWAGTTLALLTAVPGTYVWRWPGDTFTLHVGVAPPPPAPAGPAAIPTVSEWGLLLLAAALGALGLVRMRRRQ